MKNTYKNCSFSNCKKSKNLNKEIWFLVFGQRLMQRTKLKSKCEYLTNFMHRNRQKFWGLWFFTIIPNISVSFNVLGIANVYYNSNTRYFLCKHIIELRKWTSKQNIFWESSISYCTRTTVFPHIRPAGIIFLQGLQMRVLLERGYYSRASIIF